MLDEINGDRRLVIFELGDNRIKHRPIRRFLSSMLVDGWNLIDLSISDKCYMKFVKKIKRKRKRKNRYLNEGVKT